MAEQRCNAADAFAILRTASQNRNIKLRQVAEQIITGITGRPPQPPVSSSPQIITEPSSRNTASTVVTGVQMRTTASQVESRREAAETNLDWRGDLRARLRIVSSPVTG